MFRKNGNTIIGSECEKFTAESMTFKKFDKFAIFLNQILDLFYTPTGFWTTYIVQPVLAMQGRPFLGAGAAFFVPELPISCRICYKVLNKQQQI